MTTGLRSTSAMLAVVLISCAPASAGPTDGGTAREAAVEGGAGDGGVGVPERCNAPQEDVVGAGAACVRAVEGALVSDDGTPLGGHVVTVCGAACFATTADAQGRFVVPIGEVLPVPVYSVQVHGRPTHASAYWTLPTPDSQGISRFTAPLSVPRYTSEGAELPESMTVASALTVTSGPVTLGFSAATRVEFDLEDFELAALGRRVRAAEVPLDRAPPFAREAMARGPVFALGPFALVMDRPVSVRLANRAMLPAGSPVEFVAMGREVLGPEANAGRPVVVARGAVSMDGATIATSDGEGLRTLTWLAVRPR
jgi:hypothetical protein